MKLGGVWAALLVLAVCLGAAIAACGNDGGGFGGGGDGGLPGDRDGSLFDPDGGADTRVLEISPLDATVTVVNGVATSLTYEAKLGGQKVPAVFAVDRGEIGRIDAQSGLFTPAGTLGGKAFVTASFNGKSAKTSVTVKVTVVQNGDPNAGDAGAGAGGNGGVGGEGPGRAVSAQTQAVLEGTPAADPGLAWLYPYDRTVWPRGILAPLLQWRPGAQSYDAIYIHIRETNYEYKGFFARTATPFIHHPIPQAVWKQVAYSNGGEDVTIELVFSAGAAAYGPIKETWKVASAALKGTVYYNSYGTALANNFCCHLGTTQQFGGATLAIKGGSTDPVLVAGGNGNDTQCRVCHSVAAQGSTLVTQHGEDYLISSAYDLKTGNEASMTPGDGRFNWPALYPDGTFMLSNSSTLFASSALPSALYAVPSGALIPSVGIPNGLRAGAPVFSPDGNHVAFNFFGGGGGDQKSLAVMDFANGTKTFSSFQVIHTPASGHTAIWPSYLPTNDAIVFEVETRYNGRDFGGTRSDCDSSGACNGIGTRAELWWIDLKTKTPRRLDALNGVGYLPQGANAHDDDATLNYEATVNPVPSGGYAWVVFTSRRLYGNVSTINPFWSDPRFQNIRTNPTPKKLWVAAIDLNAAPGSDPSHPAFYLPAQELLAGNSRGYWVVDPCKTDGNTCETGDECCGGFCRPGADGGLTCASQAPGCAQEFDKCTTSADCCNTPSLQCINGRCAQSVPR
jgi:hypothetical protein